MLCDLTLDLMGIAMKSLVATPRKVIMCLLLRHDGVVAGQAVPLDIPGQRTYTPTVWALREAVAHILLAHPVHVIVQKLLSAGENVGIQQITQRHSNLPFTRRKQNVFSS